MIYFLIFFKNYTLIQPTYALDSAKKFVLASSQCDSDVNVRKEMYQYYVDGKSILGMMSLVGNDNLIVTYNSENSEFGKVLKKLAV